MIFSGYRRVLTTLSFLFIPLCGVIDHYTGPEVGFSIFYLMPILLVTWFFGLKMGIFASTLGAITWFLADLQWESNYSSFTILFWNAMVRMGFFLVSVILLSRIRLTNQELENKVAERTSKLQESEEKYRSLIEQLPAVVYVNKLEEKWTTLFISPQVETVWGGSMEDWIQRGLSLRLDLVHPEDREQLIDISQGLTKSGQSYETEYRFMRDGNLLWMHDKGTVLEDHEMGLLLQGVSFDITRQKQAEEKLRQSEERFRSLIENASDIITVLDGTGTILYESPSVERVFGYKPEELIGRSVFELIHEDDLSRVMEVFARSIPTPGANATVEFRLRHKDGSWRFLEAIGKSSLDENGNLVGVINSRDVTERRQAEERIQHQLRMLRALRSIDMTITNTFDLTLSLNTVINEVILQLSVKAAAIHLVDQTAQTLEFAAGDGFKTSAIQNTRTKIGEGLDGRAAYERRTVQIPNLSEAGIDFIRAQSLAEEKFISYYAVPLIIKGELEGVLEIFHDSELHPDQEWLDFLETLAGQAAIAIDNALLFNNLQRSNEELEQRVAERTEELNQMNFKLEGANRTKDEFLANMSHELRTPLNSILGLSESLLEQRRGTLNEQQQQSLGIVASSGRHLLELINDILDLSKIEAGRLDFHPQAIVVDDMCRSSLGFVKEQATRKSITIHYTKEKAVSRIFADPRRLKQILVNLLSNAVKFTPEGGEVTLQVNSDATQNLVQFSVIDNGIGIAPQDLKRLFQPFVQVDSELNRQFEGTGLGLALVQRLTDMHGGSIHVESEANKGSRFTVNLPWDMGIMDPNESAGAGDELSTKEPAENTTSLFEKRLKSGVILLVEDNMSNILTVGEYLEIHGYKVISAHNGYEALEKAEEITPDIILMDIQMPVMDGLEATRRLRADTRFSSTPIIALTALAMPGDRERCLEAGANEYLSKPVSLKRLVKTIDIFLSNGN